MPEPANRTAIRRGADHHGHAPAPEPDFANSPDSPDNAAQRPGPAPPPQDGPAPPLQDGPAPQNSQGMTGRIAILLPRFSLYGGVEQFGYRLAEALAGRGHAVDFLCARKEAEPPPGVTVKSVGRPRGFRVLKMLWFLVGAEILRRAGNYDVAVSLGKTWNQDLSRMGGGPLRVFWEKSERALPRGRQRRIKRLLRRLSPANWLTLLLEKRQFREGSDVIAVSHLVRDWLLTAHPALDPERVTVVYNRPDPERFSPPSPQERASARQALIDRAGLDPSALSGTSGTSGPSEPSGAAEPVFIGTASTNFQLKGLDPLIRALALVPERAMLFVAGGRDVTAYRALARSLGLEDRVFFLGRVDAMPAFYRALDIFILPTFYDACSNAVLEALASGCKVLTSRSNGAAFFLEPEAVLPDPGNVRDMADRLRAFMDRPAPGPFLWPDTAPAGLEAFVDRVERYLAVKKLGKRG